MDNPMTCDRCDMVSINGIPCHETGCPNAKKEWNGEEWVKMFECIECGSQYEDADDAALCCTTDFVED